MKDEGGGGPGGVRGEAVHAGPGGPGLQLLHQAGDIELAVVIE